MRSARLSTSKETIPSIFTASPLLFLCTTLTRTIILLPLQLPSVHTLYTMNLATFIHRYATFGLLFLPGLVLSLTCQKDDPGHYPDNKHQFAKSDIVAIIDSLKQDKIAVLHGPPIKAPSISAQKTDTIIISHQTARICLNNPNLFFTTDISFDQLEGKLQEFIDTCCTDSSGLCMGGSTDQGGLKTNIDHKGTVNIFVMSSVDGINNCMNNLGDSPADIQAHLRAWGVGFAAGAGIPATLLGGAAAIFSTAEAWAARFGGKIALAGFQGLLNRVPVAANAFTSLEVVISTETFTISEGASDQAIKNIVALLVEDGVLAAEEVTAVEAAEAAAVGAAAAIEGFGDFKS